MFQLNPHGWWVKQDDLRTGWFQAPAPFSKGRARQPTDVDDYHSVSYPGLFYE